MTATVAPSNATNNTIRWVKDSGTDGIDIDPSTGLVTALVGGRIKVHAEALDGSGVVSDSFWLYCVPSKVPTLNVDRVGYSSIQLSWDAVPGAVGYKVYYKALSLGDDDWNVARVEEAGNTTLLLQSLRNKTNDPNKDRVFQIKIMAYSVSANQTKSNTGLSAVTQVNLITENDVDTPTVSVKSYTSNSVTLSLSAGSNTEYFYINYYANKVDGVWQIDEDIEEIPADVGTYTITGLPANTKVYFDVSPETWDMGVITEVWKGVYVTTKANPNAPDAPD